MFLQISLWGNKCDLSISASQENAQTTSILDQLHHLNPNILIDDTADVMTCLRSRKQGRPISIVLDNAGFELLTDLCLAELLIAYGFASSICFHGKAMPWFVSDVTQNDFGWTLDMLAKSDHAGMSHFGNLWKDRMSNGTWTLTCHDFWTLPFDYGEMRRYAPDLYRELGNSTLTFLKGDLNYRKLVADRKWQTTTNFESSLRGFHPSPLCALRTCKADVIVGLRDGQAETLKALDVNWMLEGNWAVISYCGMVASIL